MIEFKRTICLEEMVSRIPSLFAYCEFDDLGVFRTHKATNSRDGSYGKIACGIRPPYKLTLKFPGEETKTIAESGECISYRTLMNYYHNAKKEGLEKSQNSLIKFVERGIGLVEIKLTYASIEMNGGNCRKWEYEYSDDHKFIFDVEPSKIEKKIYLSQARKLYNEMAKLKKLCHEYQRERETTDRKEILETSNICCICDDYIQRGGDTMVDILEFLISEAESIANEYYSYSCLDKTTVNLSVNLSDTYNDPGYYTPYLLNWKPGQVIHNGEKFIHENQDGEMTMYQNNTGSDYYGSYDEYNERVVFNESDVTEVRPQLTKYNDEGERLTNQNESMVIEINQNTDSKLKSLRRYTSHTDSYGEQDKPEEDEDWLYFYTRGAVRNLRTKNDELGNIGFYDPNFTPSVGNVVNCLMAYGDIVQNIVADNSTLKITFTYITGAHLKAELKRIGVDDDRNKFYFYGDFVVDEDGPYSTNCGIYYTETYDYDSESALYELVESGDFENYIDDVNEIKRFTGEVYPFYTGNANLSYDKRIDTKNAEINYQNTTLSYTKSYDINIFNADIFKEDYLMGIHFKPYVEDNVDIDRGKNAAFERHIKLGDVKTLQDLENYQNGGFFNIKEY